MTRDEAARYETEIEAQLGASRFDAADSLALRYAALTTDESPTGAPASAPWFRARYLSAQVALAAGRLRETLNRTEPLLRWVAELPAVVDGRLNLIRAEAFARLGTLDAAREHLARVVRHLAGLEIAPALRFRILRVRLWLGEVRGLSRELAECARALRDDIDNLALLLCEEGRAWEREGDLQTAAQFWSHAEQVARRLEPGPIRSDVLIQLGRAEHVCGRFAAALDRFEEARAGAPVPQSWEVQLRRLLVLIDLGEADAIRPTAPLLLDQILTPGCPEEVRALASRVRNLLAGA